MARGRVFVFSPTVRDLLCSLSSARWDVDGRARSAWRRLDYVRDAHENDAGRKGFLRHVLPHLLRARRTERGGRGRPPWPTVSTKRVVRSSLIGKQPDMYYFLFSRANASFLFIPRQRAGPSSNRLNRLKPILRPPTQTFENRNLRLATFLFGRSRPIHNQQNRTCQRTQS